MEKDIETWVDEGLGTKLSDEKRRRYLKPRLRRRRAHDGDLKQRRLRLNSLSKQKLHLLPENLCTDQRATVLTDVESGVFRIARGTEQSGPLSSHLSNSVLQSPMEKTLKLG